MMVNAAATGGGTGTGTGTGAGAPGPAMSSALGSNGSGDWSVPVVALFYEVISTLLPDFF